MSGLPREVLKWIQGLDLTWQVKNPKWDLSNGYLIAEIFSWYFPQEILMHSFYNGTSLLTKQKNWFLLKNFIRKKQIDVVDELLDGTIHNKEGAAALLLERLYEHLTNRKARKHPDDNEADFTDHAYQLRLPMHARATAASSVRANLRSSEIAADKNIIVAAQKAQCIIAEHIEQRQNDRKENPKRFNIKPTLGDLSPRKAQSYASHVKEMEESTYFKGGSERGDLGSEPMDHTSIPEPVLPKEPSSVQFKEVNVKQMDKRAFYTLPVQSY